MTQFTHTPAPFMPAWRDYQTISAKARTTYLEQVTRAYREYLDTPYPDRAAYETAEHNYWLTYYHTCRQAWRHLEEIMQTPPPPPAASTPSFTAVPAAAPHNEFDQRQETYLAADQYRRDDY